MIILIASRNSNNDLSVVKATKKKLSARWIFLDSLLYIESLWGLGLPARGENCKKFRNGQFLRRV